MKIKVAFLGFGKMGRAAAKTVIEAPGMEIVQAFDPKEKGQDTGTLARGVANGIMVMPSERPKIDADVAVDFSNSQGVVANSRACADAGCDLIVGTTGLDEKAVGEIRRNMEGLGLIISPNMSVGVNVFWQLIEKAAKKLPGYDIEIVEAHHRFKKDAPSGTALKALDIIKDIRGGEAVFGRSGECPRKEGDIGVHSIRASDIIGEHKIIFSAIGERFEIGHIAHTRESFATGIPKAIRFINGRKGFFNTWEALGLSESEV